MPEAVDGLRLHLSGNNPTGYLGVKQQDGRFIATHAKQHLGSFDTAVEAAVPPAAATSEEESGDGGRISRAEL